MHRSRILMFFLHCFKAYLFQGISIGIFQTYPIYKFISMPLLALGWIVDMVMEQIGLYQNYGEGKHFNPHKINLVTR